MVTKKPTVKEKTSKPEEPQAQKTSPIETPPTPQKESTTTPKPEKPSTPPPLTMKQLHQELETIKQVVDEHAQLIVQLQETLARKRKPVASNGKVQIHDKQTGTVYPSKNNAYQSLLKAGELKDLVDKGIFGPDPEKNTFGWYALVREWPDRFEEVPTTQNSK
jgi:hypothetical protein